MKILVVDDEKEIADLIEYYLRSEEYETVKCYSGNAVLKALKEHTFDLAILDVMLPEIDGFTLCRMIRETYTFPIIMLTAKIENVDKINGLMIGADDYITKPFNPLELLARVKAQLRRVTRYNTNIQKQSIIDHQGLIINKDTHECILYDGPIILTPIEFNILWLLCENMGRVVSSEELFEKVWGERFFDSNNTVTVHIRRLREKLNEPKNPKFIKTVWGVGYKIDK